MREREKRYSFAVRGPSGVARLDFWFGNARCKRSVQWNLIEDRLAMFTSGGKDFATVRRLDRNAGRLTEAGKRLRFLFRNPGENQNVISLLFPEIDER